MKYIRPAANISIRHLNAGGGPTTHELQVDTRAIPFSVMATVHEPDDWSIGLINTLLSIGPGLIPPRVCLDVGVGTGIVILAAACTWKRSQTRFMGCDLNSNAIVNTAFNFRLHRLTARLQLIQMNASSEVIPKAHEVDLVILNVPQIRRPEVAQGQPYPGELNNDYYVSCKTSQSDAVEAFGLGLVRDIILNLTQQISPSARLILNWSSRVPRRVFTELLNQTGLRLVQCGPKFDVLDEHSDLTDMAQAERAHHQHGRYYLDGKCVNACYLASVAPRPRDIQIKLMSMLIERKRET